MGKRKPKRPPGRPRKYPKVEKVIKKRGRPRVRPIEEVLAKKNKPKKEKILPIFWVHRRCKYHHRIHHCRKSNRPRNSQIIQDLPIK